jgi:hypothetical protein
MCVLLYAIAEGDAEAVDGTGLDGYLLRGVEEAGLVAVVSDHRPRAATPTSVLWEYEETVEALMRRLTVLPLRFGSVLVDDAAARVELRQRRAWLRQALNRARGAVELDLRASWEVGEAEGTIVCRRRRALSVAERLAPLRPLARASTQRVLPESSVPVRAAYLVARGRTHEFARAVQCLDRELADATLVCTGPWPPYNFARERHS